jgi:hypothetical protein
MRRVVARPYLKPKRPQVFHIPWIGVAPSNSNALSVEKLGKRTHPRASNADKMHRPDVFTVEKMAIHFVRKEVSRTRMIRKVNESP